MIRPLRVVFTFGAFLIILALLAFRLLWGLPAFRVLIRLFPKSGNAGFWTSPDCPPRTFNENGRPPAARVPAARNA